MSRTVESIKKTQDNRYKNITRNYVLLVLTVIVALALGLAIAGYVLSGGILPNAHQGLSLITYPTEQQLVSSEFCASINFRGSADVH